MIPAPSQAAQLSISLITSVQLMYPDSIENFATSLGSPPC
jgi:hypothetical protein